MNKPVWKYSWTWSVLDEKRLNSAANELDRLANDISALAAEYLQSGKSSLQSDMSTDAGNQYETELEKWKSDLDLNVVQKLRSSASLIRATVLERDTLWDTFQKELKKFRDWEKEQLKKAEELLIGDD